MTILQGNASSISIICIDTYSNIASYLTNSATLVYICNYMQLLVAVPCCALIMSNNKPMRHLGPGQSQTKTHSAWVMLVRRAAIWAISPRPPNRPTYGTAGSAMVEIKSLSYLFFSFHVCLFIYMPIPRILGLAQVGPGFVLGSQ